MRILRGDDAVAMGPRNPHRGGRWSLGWYNRRPSCKRCNLQMGSMPLRAWLEVRGTLGAVEGIRVDRRSEEYAVDAKCMNPHAGTHSLHPQLLSPRISLLALPRMRCLLLHPPGSSHAVSLRCPPTCPARSDDCPREPQVAPHGSTFNLRDVGLSLLALRNFLAGQTSTWVTLLRILTLSSGETCGSGACSSIRKLSCFPIASVRRLRSRSRCPGCIGGRRRGPSWLPRPSRRSSRHCRSGRFRGLRPRTPKSLPRI